MACVGGKVVVVSGAAGGQRAAEARALADAGVSIAAGGWASSAHPGHDAVCCCGFPLSSADVADELRFAGQAS